MNYKEIIYMIQIILSVIIFGYSIYIYFKEEIFGKTRGDLIFDMIVLLLVFIISIIPFIGFISLAIIIIHRFLNNEKVDKWLSERPFKKRR